MLAPRFWQKRGWQAFLLFPISALFGLIAIGRRFFYRCFPPQPLPVPVIVVGNVVVGGSGKTPVLMALVAALKDQGWHPGVVSRGYGRRRTLPEPHLLTTADLAEDVGDEPLLITTKTKVPVVIAVDRPRAARHLLQHHPECNVIVADDGLQHFPLFRDIEIAVFGAQGIGNGFCLPAGPLRESWRRPVDVRLWHVAEGFSVETLPPFLRPHGKAFVVEGSIGTPYELHGGKPLPMSGVSGDSPQEEGDANIEKKLRDKVFALAGIGNPQRFFAALRDKGLGFIPLPLPDHYRFDTNFFARFDRNDLVLMTEKDAIKCTSLFQPEPSCGAQAASVRDYRGVLSDLPRLYVVPYQVVLPPPLLAFLSDRLQDCLNQRCKVQHGQS